jgi:PKD repeat protein
MNENKKRTLRIINPKIVVIASLLLLYLAPIGILETISKKMRLTTTKIYENHGYKYRYGKFSILITGIVISLFLIPLVTAAAPVAQFTGTPTNGPAPLTVTFTDKSNGNPTGRAWFFGDENYSEPWTQKTASAGWPGRDFQSSVAMPDGSIVLMGGNSYTFYNDVWRSTDEGASWTQQTANPGWVDRSDLSSVAMPDGSIVLMGGNSGSNGPLKDVWRSTDDGATWTEVNANAAWPARFSHRSVAMPDGSIVLMGGQSSGSDFFNDVWQSKDEGTSWTEVNTSAGWPGRAGFNIVAMPDGSIVLMGGHTSGGSGAPLNDVWRSTDDGVTWTEVNASAGWSARYGQGSVAMPDGSIVLMGGRDTYGDPLNDVWQSKDDGATWTELPTAGWMGRYGVSSVAMPDGSIVLMGGYNDFSYTNYNDVWRLMPAGSSLKNPSHTYTVPGIYQVSLQAYNANGYNSTRKTGYVTVTAPSAPVAAFTGAPTSGIAPLPVSFTDQSTNAPTGWAWYFGDENYTEPWTEVNASAGWPVRQGQSAVVTPDGSIVLMGGVNPALTADFNDTWRSTDGGATWTEVNEGARWPARTGQSSVAMPDGSIVLMGGSNGGIYSNDVWRLTDEGATWTEVNAGAGWPARTGQSSVAMPDGSIVLMGGYGYAQPNYMNDVWRSTDNGTTWTEVNASAGWPARDVASAVAMPDGSIVLMGGQNNSGYLNDVWRSTDDGATWTLITGGAAWPARSTFSSVAMPDGSIALMGGWTNSGYANDVWRSTNNGATWTEVNASAGWDVRAGQSTVAMPDGSIVLMGGVNTNDVWRFMPAGSSLKNPSHTYTTPGSYKVALQVYNANGYTSTRKTGYVTVTAPAAPVTTTTPVSTPTYNYGGYSSGGGGGGAGAGPAGAAQSAVAQPAAQPAAPAVALPNPATNPGIAPPAATASYPAGFPGLSYNANGKGTVSIDMASAAAAGATVTTYFDRVTVYQHHSPGVLLTFWGNNFTFNKGSITGPVSRAEFVTDPLNATLAFGNISGSVHAELPALTQRVYLNLTVPGNVSTETLTQFQDILSGNGLQLNTVAYTFSVQKVNLTTGPANVTFTIPASWVNQNGGKDAVRITRISDETGKQELLDTVYEGLDDQGNMIFRGDSPNGLSLFGLVTAEAYAAEQKANPNTTYVGVSKSSMVTNVGMYSWLIEIILHNQVVLIGVIALLAVIAYFGWWKRRL